MSLPFKCAVPRYLSNRIVPFLATSIAPLNESFGSKVSKKETQIIESRKCFSAAKEALSLVWLFFPGSLLKQRKLTIVKKSRNMIPVNLRIGCNDTVNL